MHYFLIRSLDKFVHIPSILTLSLSTHGTSTLFLDWTGGEFVIKTTVIVHLL